MKHLFSMWVTLVSLAGVGQAATLFDCDLELFDKSNGALLGNRSFMVTYENYVPVELPNRLSGLSCFDIRMTEGGGEHDGWLELEVQRPFGGYFNASGLGATFGDESVFGKIQCRTVSSGYHFVTADGRVFLDTVKPGLYGLLAAQGTCVAGDPVAAARALAKHWYLPVYDIDGASTITTDRDGIRWFEIEREGVDPVDNGGDLPTTNYRSWKEIIRTPRFIPVCR